LRDEAVHLAAVDVRDRVRLAVRASAVEVIPVVIGLDAGAGRVRQADILGQSIGARKGTEVAIEGAVLLHDHDHVLDLVDSGIGVTVSENQAGAEHRGGTDQREHAKYSLGKGHYRFNGRGGWLFQLRGGC
jgi:hypothetical protein